MKNLSRHYGTLVSLERMPSSINGNPRYRAFIDCGNGTGINAVTKPDSSIGYCIDNFRYKTVFVTVGTYYGKTTIANIEKA